MEPKNEFPPANYTKEEQAKLEKSRAISDAALLEEGAKRAVSENGERELLVEEYPLNRLERLNHPYFKMLLKYFDIQTMESIVLPAEGASNYIGVNQIVETKWKPLLEQLMNDPEFQKDFQIPNGLKIKVNSGVYNTLDILSFFDSADFGELRHRAFVIDKNIKRKFGSQKLNF